MKRNLLILIIPLMLSCSTERTLTQVKIEKGTKLINHYVIDPNNYLREHYFIIYKTKDVIDATIKVEETNIKITPNDKSLLDTLGKLYPYINDTSCIDLAIELDPSLKLANKYSYYNELKNDSLDLLILDKEKWISREEKVLNKSYVSFSPVKYHSSNCFFQTLTIPFKIRGKTNNTPCNVSTGFNAGFAYGKLWDWKKTTPIYSSEDHKMKGYDMKNTSIGLAPFFGLTTIKLSAENTQNSITTSQTVLGGTIGGVAVFRLNKMNLGFGFGIDYGFNNSSNWDYQGKPWFGIVIGIDVIK